MNEYRKDGYFYIRNTEPWQEIQCGGKVKRKGDLLTNTLNKILDDKDTTVWAYAAFMACADQLVWRNRWPDRMNQSYDANNWLRWKWSQFWYRLCHYSNLELNWFGHLMSKMGASVFLKYRPQGNMTRDPYVYFYCCAVFFKREQFIMYVKPPWYLRTSMSFNRWRKRLIRDNRKKFVKKLDAYMALATYLKLRNEL